MFPTWSGLILDLDEVQCVSSVEEEWSECGVDLAVAPVLAEDVGRVDLPRDVVKAHHFGCHGLSREMIGECVVSLGQLRVGNSAALDH